MAPCASPGGGCRTRRHHHWQINGRAVGYSWWWISGCLSCSFVGLLCPGRWLLCPGRYVLAAGCYVLAGGVGVVLVACVPVNSRLYLRVLPGRPNIRLSYGRHKK